LPLVAPIVSSELTSDRGDLSTTARVTAQQQQPSPLQSAHVNLKEAKVAVKLSQAQLAQARINLIEFRAKHNSSKILSAQGKVNRQHADTAKAAYELAQLQHKSASIGLQESQAQLVAAQAEVSKLGRKANLVKQM
jgi:multidrug resistance efflux pump